MGRIAGNTCLALFDPYGADSNGIYAGKLVTWAKTALKLTHVMWHRVAPALAGQFTVICPDLRGYGDSDKPPGGPDHEGYSKRVMAQDQVAVMAALDIVPTKTIYQTIDQQHATTVWRYFFLTQPPTCPST